MAHSPSFNMGGVGPRPSPNQGNFNRPPANSNINRANVGNTNINRTNMGNINNINRNNNFTNVNVNRNNIGNINGGNNYRAGSNGGWGYGGGWGPTHAGGGWGPGSYGGRYGPGYWGGNHSGWMNGYWNNNWGGIAAVGVGAGLLGWSLGSSIYNWGYSPYVNPYLVQQTVVVPGQGVASTYDYSQPINTEIAPPPEEVVNGAEQSFDEARSLFKAGDYPGALVKIDMALSQTPSDATAHEFRALVLFATQKYAQAAETLYSVLSVGPGWDWSTMIGLYPDVETYTAQLRALEAYCKAHGNDSAPIFVLGYQYLTMGQTEAAKPMFERVTKLQPSDKLASTLFQKLGGGPTGQPIPAVAANDPVQPQALSASVYDANDADLVGVWTAKPAQGVTINITFTADGKFNWVVDQNGKKNTITGETSMGKNLLTLAGSEQGSVMVGNCNWTDATHFTFKIVGGPADDPGLSLVKPTVGG